MTQNIELEKVKAKIRALTARTIDNGASEAEAMTAMKKVGELLAQFNLNMTDVTVRDEMCIQKDVDTGSKHRGIQYDVAVSVAAFTNCKIWQTSWTKSKKLHFFGMESDVEMAVYLLNYIKIAYDNAFAEFKNSDTYVNYAGHRRVLTTNFLRGFANRLNDRLDSMKREFVREEKSSTGTALVVIEKSKYVEEEYQKLGMKLRKTYTTRSSNYNGAARAAGDKAGNKVNLNRPVTGGSSFGGYLS